jgi:hypothetical protein
VIDIIMADFTNRKVSNDVLTKAFTEPYYARGKLTAWWRRVETGFILSFSSGPVANWERWNLVDSDKDHQGLLEDLGCGEHPRIITIEELKAAFESVLPEWIQTILQREKDKADRDARDVRFGWTTLRFRAELTDLSAQRINMPPPFSRSSLPGDDDETGSYSTSKSNIDTESGSRSWASTFERDRR